MIELADRLGQVEEYYFSKKLAEIAALKAVGKDILNLGIGSPDLAPHPEVIEELHKVSNQDHVHGYQSYKGIPELRSAFANWYNSHYKVVLNSDSQILPLIGSKEGIMHVSMTYLNPGDEVLIPNPGYPAYAATTKLTGAKCRYYQLTEENNWLPSFEELENSDLSKVKLMWVNYPHMPTGTQATQTLFDRLKAFGEKHQILICNDNPYSFILNDHPISLLNSGISDYTLELNSLSKSHNMAGWRMGMIAANELHIQNILTFKSNMDSGSFLPIQRAAIKALSLPQSWYYSQNLVYRKRRELVFQIMDELGCEYRKNQVGMFVWAKISARIADVEAWIDEILQKAEVFITPGFIFGDQGNRYIRISLCAKEEIFKEALKRIKRVKEAI